MLNDQKVPKVLECVLSFITLRTTGLVRVALAPLFLLLLNE